MICFRNWSDNCILSSWFLVPTVAALLAVIMLSFVRYLHHTAMPMSTAPLAKISLSLECSGSSATFLAPGPRNYGSAHELTQHICCFLQLLSPNQLRSFNQCMLCSALRVRTYQTLIVFRFSRCPENARQMQWMMTTMSKGPVSSFSRRTALFTDHTDL